MHRSTPKQYLLLQGRPVLCHTVMAFNKCSEVDKIILVVPEKDIPYCRDQLLSDLYLEIPIDVLAGGQRRQDSVFNGILSIEDRESIVVIHDGVRPLVRPEMISACINKARTSGACILGIPVQDTLKSVRGDGAIQGTIQREKLWLAQTPQAFHYQLIRNAHTAASRDGVEGTDDAMLLERMGVPVNILLSRRENLKITTNEDLMLADAILSQARKEN